MTKPIDASEYDAILACFRQLGKSDQAAQQIATEFNRGITTIERLRRRA